MSYYNASSTGNNPLSFPSYNQQTIQQRSISGISPINNSVNQLQNQYNESSLNTNLHQGEGSVSQQTSTFINPEREVANAQGGSVNGVGSDRQQGPGQRDRKDLLKTNLKRDRRNRPGQKFGAKKRLWVWSWFVQDLSDQNVAVCDFCGKVIKRVASDRGLPKKLSEHLHTHKLTKNLINPSRSMPIDGSGLTFSNTNLQVPFTGAFSRQLGSRDVNNDSSVLSQTHLGLTSSPQQVHHVQLMQQKLQSLQSQGQESQPHQQHQQQQQHHHHHHTNTESIAPELKQNAPKYRRTNAINTASSDTQQIHPQLQQQLQQQLTQEVTLNPNSSIQYNRRFILSNFENSPYSGSKFHRHILKFLAENKLSIRILKLHSFQQLIYDLRPDSITDLLELTGLYSSFVEVARAENLSNVLDGRDSSIAEANVVNTLAQELIKR